MIRRIRRKKLLLVFSLFILAAIGIAASYPTVPHTFAPRQIISSSDTNDNNNAWKNSDSDGTKRHNIAELEINGTMVIDNSRGLFGTSLTVSNNITAPTLNATSGLVVDTNTLFVDGTTNRVGIGTVSPAYLLELSPSSGDSSIYLNSTNSVALISLDNNDTSSWQFGLTSDMGANTRLGFRQNGIVQGFFDNGFFTTNILATGNISATGNLLVSGNTTISGNTVNSGTFRVGPVPASAKVGISNTDDNLPTLIINSNGSGTFGNIHVSISASNPDATDKVLLVTPNGSGGEFAVFGNGAIGISDGIPTPSAQVGWGTIFIDSADGDLKIKFGDGTTKTIVTD